MAEIDKSRFEDMTYDEFMEILKIEIGDFIRHAESGKMVRYQGLRARKKSMRLREILKVFRVKSIQQERKITNIYKSAKDEVRNT